MKSTLMVWFAMKHQPVLSGQERIKLDYNQETDGRERGNLRALAGMCEFHLISYF